MTESSPKERVRTDEELKAKKAAKMRQYHLDNPEVRARQLLNQENRRRNPETWAANRLSNLRCTAKKRGLEFSISEEDLVLPEFCPVFGTPFNLGVPVSDPSCPTVDRFDNSLGYIPGNVRIISSRANILKRDATVEELEAVVAYMKDF